MRMLVGWEPTEGGKFYVVEYDGMLKTGPFRTQEGAKTWFSKELEKEIYFEEDHHEREDETTDQERETGAATEDTEYLRTEGPTETFVSHCPGCASSR